MDYDRMTTAHDIAHQPDLPLPAPATASSASLIHPDEPTGATAREIAGLPPLTGPQIREMNLAARYGGSVPAWRRALDNAIETDPRGSAGVAERLGVSRPYVSRVANFSMKTAPAAFIERVAAVYLRVECPHLATTIAPAECRTYARREFRLISQFEVDHWRACQRCPNKAPPAAPKEGSLL